MAAQAFERVTIPTQMEIRGLDSEQKMSPTVADRSDNRSSNAKP
jgi:hypothetical protein